MNAAVITSALLATALVGLAIGAIGAHRRERAAARALTQANEQAAHAALLARRDIAQARAEVTALLEQLDKALGQAATATLDEHETRSDAQAQVLNLITSAAWVPGDPHRPANASINAVIEAITDTSLALETYRRAEYIAAHPAYTQGWEAPAPPPPPTEAAR